MSIEHITAIKFQNRRLTELNVYSTRRFASDINFAHESKSKLQAEVQGGNQTRKINFVRKELFDTAEGFYQKWNYLKTAGLPVVPTLRYVSYSSILMTDLSQGGARLFGKYAANRSNSVLFSKAEEGFRRVEYTDIEKASKTIVKNASLNKVLLAADDPMEMIVYPDGRWNLLLLDLTEVRILKKHNIEIDLETLIDYNTEYNEHFLKNIRFLRLPRPLLIAKTAWNIMTSTAQY